MLDWLRSKRVLIAELEEGREQVVDMAKRLQAAIHDRTEAEDERDAARSEARQLRQRLGKAIVKQDRGDRAIEPVPVARTPSQELQLERARADALGARVQQLQEANVRAGCMHGIPVQGRVSASGAAFGV